MLWKSPWWSKAWNRGGHVGRFYLIFIMSKYFKVSVVMLMPFCAAFNHRVIIWSNHGRTSTNIWEIYQEWINRTLHKPLNKSFPNRALNSPVVAHIRKNLIFDAACRYSAETPRHSVSLTRGYIDKCWTKWNNYVFR